VFDCIVVGLGPAGAIALREISQAGLNVIGLEKSALPHRKTCAGALSGLAQRHAPAGVDQLFLDQIHMVELSCPPHLNRRWEFDQPVACLIDRAQFHAFLLKGLPPEQIQSQTKVLGITVDDEGVLVHTSRGMLKTKTLIGADGAHSQVALKAGLIRPRCGLGLEVAVPQRDCQWRERIYVQYGQPPWGYGWIFSKGDHLSVGVVSLREEKTDLRPYLQNLLNRHQLSTSAKALGHPIPLGPSKKGPIAREGILLAGDAAGLADPLTGEGIAYALTSGRLAAQEVINALERDDYRFSDYQREVWQRWGSQLHLSSKIAACFYRFPRVTNWFLQHYPEVIKGYFHSVGQAVDYGQLVGQIKGKIVPFIDGWAHMFDE
jgi:geranylgeranyl reductase family protein